MSRRDNNVLYGSIEGQWFLRGRLSALDPETIEIFWIFHDFLEKTNLSSHIEVRTGDAKRNGTTVYHGKMAMMWINIRTDDPKWIEIVFYTGVDNQAQFPGTTPCVFRKGFDGAHKFNLTSNTLETAQRFAKQSASILDCEVNHQKDS